MDYTKPAVKDEADNLIIRKDVKAFLRSFEERGATVGELDAAISQLQAATSMLSKDALVKADCLGSQSHNPFWAMFTDPLQGRG